MTHWNALNAETGGPVRRIVKYLASFCLLAGILLAGIVSGTESSAVAASKSHHEASTSVLTWGDGEGPNATGINGLPGDTTLIQAANWGGLAVDGGTVYSWNASANPTAAPVQGPSDVVALGEGGGSPYGAAVTESGTLWTWGVDRDGQLCNGITGNDFSANPTSVNDAEAVSGGQEHLLVLTTDHTVFACGNNDDGQLGDGSLEASDTPVEVSLDNITAISAGDFFSMALNSQGDVFTWGQNSFGQLGDGSAANSDTAVEVRLPSPAVEIYAGGSRRDNGSAIALLQNGDVYAWGNDSWGQLGPGASGNSDVPVEVGDLPPNVVSVAEGGADSFAITANGDLYAWGEDQNGELGNGEEIREVGEPQRVAIGVSQISAVARQAVDLSPS